MASKYIEFRMKSNTGSKSMHKMLQLSCRMQCFLKVLDAKSVKDPSTNLTVRTLRSDDAGKTQGGRNDAFSHHESRGEAKLRGKLSCEPSLEEAGRENIKVKEQSTWSQLMKMKNIYMLNHDINCIKSLRFHYEPHIPSILMKNRNLFNKRGVMCKIFF